MDKPIIVGGIILATLVIAGYAIYDSLQYKPERAATNQSAAETTKKANPEPPKTGTTTVTYDNNGFQPKEITITKGTTVNFIATTERRMWVASNPHPDHTDYPEFDTENDFGDHVPDGNKTYDFRFDKTGTWKYHNHSAPEHEAVIKVQ